MQSDRFACPCCGFLTIAELGMYDLCDVCFWEDDGSSDWNVDEESGPNHMSLKQGRANYDAFGAMDRDFLNQVRPPRPSEIPSERA